MSSATPGQPKRGGGTRRLNGPLLALAVVALVGGGFLAARYYWGMPPGPAADSGARQGEPGIGGPFTLVDQDGRTVTDADFHGRWLLVYFGFTYCPDICPTSLTRNSDGIELLGEKGDKVTPVLISIDPERDTPQKMKEYVHFFHPRMVGLTGRPEQVAAVGKAYRVFYMKAPGDTPDTYVVDHSSFTYLVDPNGRFVQFFRHEASAQEVADKLKPLL